MQMLSGEAEKDKALAAFVEHVIPGRSADARAPNASELKATTIVSLSLDEASAKIRTGPPKDDKPDYALPVWAGVLPLQQDVTLEPVSDPVLTDGIPVPDYVSNYSRTGSLAAEFNAKATV